MPNLTPGTTTNGITIVSAANGLSANFRPDVSLWLPIRSDVVAGQAPSVMVGTDGHIEAWGVGGATRWDVNVCFMAGDFALH
jgi:hypothetical protein